MKLGDLMVILIILIFVLGGPICWVTSSYFESQSYNRLTGAHTTTWDAMFLQLRVMEPVKK